MIYTYPIFFWGLTALIIPIVVHLFNFRKVKRVSFSNVHFLESIKKKTSSNLRLKHLLILFSRLFFIFFLVVTFTQPTIPGTENGLQGKSVTLFLDNSYSMSNLTENGASGFNEMLTIAEQIVLLYPDETMFKLLTNDFIAEASNMRSMTKTLEKITEIEYSSTSRSGEEILSKIRSKGNETNKDIFILSDFQKSTIGKFGTLSDSANQYHIIPINFENYNNIYIDTVYLSSPFLIPNQPNSVNVRLKNSSADFMDDMSIKFNVNDRQVGTATVDLEKNGFAELNFPLTGNLKKVNKCRISFEEFPISFDNDFLFILKQISEIKIVEIKSNPQATPISRVFEAHSLFNTKSYQQETISYKDVEVSDLLIINQVEDLNTSIISQMESQLDKGRTVIFIPSENHTNDILGLSVSQTTDSTSASLSVPDIKNPFYKNIFESIERNTQMPIVRTAVQWLANDVDLLRTKTGKSFLSHVPDEGNLFLFSSPFTDKFTDFHKHALFVPVLQRIAELSSSNLHTLYRSSDVPNITIQVDSISRNQLYRMKMGDSELIPSQRISSNQLVMNMPIYLIQPGYYELTLGNNAMNTLAFNHPKKESDLESLSVAEIKSEMSRIKKLKLFEEVSPDSFSLLMKEKFHSRKLWKYALVLSLIFLLVESALIRLLK